MPRRHGNPLWASDALLQFQPAGICEFEMYTQELRLSEHEYAGSPELRKWCEEHKNRSYIPEWLLKRWGMDVDTEALAPIRTPVMRRNPLT
jgi:hypothetical protein